MSTRAIAVTIAVVAAGIAGVAIAIWFSSQQRAEGQVNAILDRAGAPRRPTRRGEVPAGAQQAMDMLTQEYVLAANTVPPNPRRITEILEMVRALRRRYPGIRTALQNV
jgi:hypothetical protein